MDQSKMDSDLFKIVEKHIDFYSGCLDGHRAALNELSGNGGPTAMIIVTTDCIVASKSVLDALLAYEKRLRILANGGLDSAPSSAGMF